MTTDLKALRDTLRARAETDTDPEALLARIGPAYRRRRSRRLAGAASAVVAVGALLAMLVPRLLFGGYPLPAPPAVPIGSPAAEAIGADPQMIHFDVGQFPYEVSSTTWAVQDGIEQLSMSGSIDDSGASFFVELRLAPETRSPAPNPTGLPEEPRQLHSAPATVGGRPALVVTGEEATRVTWQPIAGVRAELSVRGRVPANKAITFAGTLSLDRGHQCVPSLRPTALPADARITGCSIMPNVGHGQYVIRGPGGTITVWVFTGVFAHGISPGAPSSTLANGWPYQELDASGNTQHYTAHIRVPDPYVEIFAQGAYGLPEVLLVGAGLQPS
ncbi:hypothetical protein ACFFX1_15220 [Dactylosporangium sucinum]|uniref:Uncharacterized protein n=1 Tax=Dactylosporangium sucinum TaxID=1424081 RepID=A0A917X886_9ACTN|nr:hypothetical protein [Dactylosporangium sucinum]GGM88323.1 hypothetical protein GCM10007977_107930 [Dactylosporangium sucinum]